MIIRPAQTKDVKAFLDYKMAHLGESGGEGRPVFHPVEDFEQWNLIEVGEKLIRAWQLPLNVPGWERNWIAEEGGEVFGSAHLRGPAFSTSLHRCSLGIGMREQSRGLGYGTELLETIIKWAQAQDSLFWIDLEVYAHNPRAIQLYESFGFLTYGVTMDLYRVHGHSVDAMQMSLQLREE